MKTINFLTSHFIPENTACTNRVLSFVQELEKSYKINIITLTEKGILPEKDIWKYSDNITVHYVTQHDFNGKNFVKRAFKEIHYVGELIKLSKKLKCDLVIGTSPYMFMIPLIGFRLKGKKILDIRDLVWEYLDAKNIVNKTIKKVLTYLMKLGIKQFNHITVTNGYEENFLKKEYSIKTLSVLPNGIDYERYSKLSQLIPSETDKSIVTYVGNIGLAQNLKTFIEAASLLPDVSFVVIGSGIELKSIQNFSNEKFVKNITFTGKLEWIELEEYYKKSSILYAQLDSKYISAMPSKLYEYASVGLPIIYAGKGQATEFVDTLENAKVIEPNDSVELVSAIRSLMAKKQNISTKNRELISTYYLRENSSEKMKEIVHKMIGE